MKDLAGKHIVLGLTGGVACYKSAELCRLLCKQGASIQVVMTEGATHFVTPTTMQALSGRPVHALQWDATQHNAMPHINLTRNADAVVVAPASADFIARLAQGRADDLLSLLCMARPFAKGKGAQNPPVPLLLAPAMNREMWQHPATQRNIAQAAADGAQVLGVGQGEQACGETGDGRMLEPEEILHNLVASFQPQVWAGKKVWITAGPTFEAIDPVRGVTNLSSGKMGFAIARAAWECGAQVTLIAGPVHLPTPYGVHRVNVLSAQQMANACTAAADEGDVFIATAAVADWSVRNASMQKIKKDASGRAPVLEFAENPDILHVIAHSPRAQSGALYCVGFAAESQDLLKNAQAKRERKGVPLLAGNIGPATFGSDDNELLLVDVQGTTTLERAPKLTLARRLVAAIAQRQGSFPS